MRDVPLASDHRARGGFYYGDPRVAPWTLDAIGLFVHPSRRIPGSLPQDLSQGAHRAYLGLENKEPCTLGGPMPSFPWDAPQANLSKPVSNLFCTQIMFKVVPQPVM